MAKQKKTLRQLKNKFKRWRQNTLQAMGRLTFYLILIAILVGIFVVRYVNYEWPDVHWPPLQAEDSSKRDFINRLAPTAQSIQQEYGILASISLAQAALESDFGRSQLATDYNNLYGVKTDSHDPDHVQLPTLEYIDEEWIEAEEPFKVYASQEAAMQAHAELIYYGTSWNEDHYEAVLLGKTYKEQAKGLQNSGYATDPTYSQKIIEMIETWSLDDYDQVE